MFFAPFALLFTWLIGLLSLAVVGGGLYLLWAWYSGVVVGTGYLRLCFSSGRMELLCTLRSTDPRMRQL